MPFVTLTVIAPSNPCFEAVGVPLTARMSCLAPPVAVRAVGACKDRYSFYYHYDKHKSTYY